MTWGGDGLRTKHLVTGKGCFVILGLNFQRQNRKCPLGLGPQERNQLESAFKGGPSRVLTTAARLEFKAPSEFWCLFPLTISSSTFFFFLNGTSASFLTCWKIFPLSKLGSGTLSPCERKYFSCYTVQLFFFFFIRATCFANFCTGDIFFHGFPSPFSTPHPNLWIPRNIHTHILLAISSPSD